METLLQNGADIDSQSQELLKAAVSKGNYMVLQYTDSDHIPGGIDL